MGVEVSSVAFFASLAYDEHVLRFELFRLRPKRWQRRRCSGYTTVCTTFTIVLGGTSTEGSVDLRDQGRVFRRVWSSVIRPEPRGLQQPSRSHLCDGSFSGAGRTTGASQMSKTLIWGEASLLATWSHRAMNAFSNTGCLNGSGGLFNRLLHIFGVR